MNDLRLEKKIEKAIKIISKHEKRIKNLEKKLSGKQIVKKSAGKKSSKSSIRGLILELKSESFFKKPQSRNDIVKKLRQGGFHYNVDSLNDPLQRILRKKDLGRVGTPGKWKYVKR